MPLKQLKQIIQIKHNIVKNPNWPEADQLAIYKCGRGFELGRSVKQIQLAGLEPGTAGLRVRRADHSATLPPAYVEWILLGFMKMLFYHNSGLFLLRREWCLASNLWSGLTSPSFRRNDNDFEQLHLTASEWLQNRQKRQVCDTFEGHIWGIRGLNQIVVYTLFLWSVTFQYNSVFAQAHAKSNFELGKPVLEVLCVCKIGNGVVESRGSLLSLTEQKEKGISVSQVRRCQKRLRWLNKVFGSCASVTIFLKPTFNPWIPKTSKMHVNSTDFNAGMLLNASCWENLPAEKEVIAGWILAGNHLVKNNKRFLGYARSMIWYLNHICYQTV